MIQFLKTIWEAAQWLLPFLPKKTIGRLLVKRAKEYAQKTDNIWDDATVEMLSDFLSSIGWLPTEAELVKELEKENKQ